MLKVIGLGAGGHAKVVAEILQLIGGYELVGLLDPRSELWGTDILGIPVLGNDDLLATLLGQGVRYVFIGLGTVGNTWPREQLYKKARQQGFDIVDAVDPRAVVAPSAQLGDGLTIMAGAIINAAAWLGDNVIVNTGAIVEHDCIIGHHVHIATGARLAGAVSVGNHSHIGVGATIRQEIRIGENVVVGAGAVVVKDVPDGVVVAGVPAKFLREVK